MIYFNKSKILLFLLVEISVNAVCVVHKPIEKQVKYLMQQVPGQVGVAAMHLESGRCIEVNGDVRFPMASTYKVPIALCCLSMVDDGVLNLNDRKVFTSSSLRRGSKILPGQQLEIEKIIRLMIEYSDNAASDMIFKIVGGGNAVTNWLRKHGINDIRVDRSALKLCADISGIKLDDDFHCTIPKCVKLMKAVSNENIAIAQKKFFDDQQDTTTPHAMVNLLACMFRKSLVSVNSTNFLLDCMAHCHIVFGKGRIPRLLPKTCKVWHKTGRIDHMDSDVGIFELPGRKGHVAIALYSNRDTRHENIRELAMAKITRAIYNYFSMR